MNIKTALVSFIVVLFGAIVHECAHGWVADKLGDPTARLAGRITLNPLPHIDPFFTILMPLIFFLFSGGRFIFGAAKPVPVNVWNLRNPRRDLIWVSAAGAGSNIALAIACGVLLRIGFIRANYSLGLLLGYGIIINLILAFFNLIPIPPLDGSKILMGILPEDKARSYSRLEPFGFIILGFLLIIGFLNLIIGVFVLPISNLIAGFNVPFYLAQISGRI